MNLTAINDQGVSSVAFALGNQPSNNDSGSNSNLWWIILVSVVGGLIVIGLIIFGVKKFTAQPGATESSDPESVKAGLIEDRE